MRLACVWYVISPGFLCRQVLRVALEAVDRLFFVGLQEEMLASGLLLLRRMDRAERLLRRKDTMDKGLDCEELRREVLNMPRERSTSTASTATAGISSTHTEPNRSVAHLGGSTNNNMSGAKEVATCCRWSTATPSRHARRWRRTQA